MRSFAGLIAIAFIASVCFFFLSFNIGNFIIEKISDARTDEKIVSELETYIRENRLGLISGRTGWRRKAEKHCGVGAEKERWILKCS